MSKKRAAETEQRANVRREVLARDGHRCRGEKLTPVQCGFLADRKVLEVHELCPRSTCPGSHLLAHLCVALCPRCHDWVGDNPLEANKVGLHLFSWEVGRA